MKDASLKPGLAARQTAVHWLAQCLQKNSPLDELMRDSTAAALAPRDRNLARLIFLTTLRRLPQIDHILCQFMNRGFPRKAGDLREILQTAVAQLLFLDMPPHAVVDCAIRLARKDRNARHLKNLANGVLRNVDREGRQLISEDDAGQLNTPDWLWNSWSAAFGQEAAKAIANMHLQPAPLDLTVKQDPQGWAEKLGGQVLPTGSVRIAKAGIIPELTGFDDGQWWVQDAAAAIPVRLFDELKGKQVVDLCAAPGGKTAQLIVAGATVTALDISPERLDRVKDNLARLKLEAELVAIDALKWSTGDQFDAVLLDAPCSSTGTIRRHPDVQRLKQPQIIKTLQPFQERLLDKAYNLLKPGGQLVYCVCSLQAEEGEGRINAFLAAHPDMKRKPAAQQKLGLPPSALTAAGDVQLRPDMFAELGGMDGFFVSVLNRQA